MYYNTNKEEGQGLEASKKKTETQETLVMGVFMLKPKWSPSEIMTHINHFLPRDYPLTSIRRALTDLTSKGVLEKTDEMKMGIYGKREHLWKLKS